MKMKKRKHLINTNQPSIPAWKQRISCILLTIVLVTGILPLYPLPVKASAVPVDAEASAEIFILLWGLMMDGLVAGGAADVVADYRSNELTFQLFMGTLHDTLMAGSPGLGTVTLSDGTQVSLNAFVAGVEDGTITVPDVTLKGVNTWFVYDSLEHWSASQPPYNIDPDDPEPEEPKFSRIKSFILGSSVFTALSATVSSLFNGEIDGVDPSVYFDVDESLFYTGQIGETAYGYWYHGTVGPRRTDGGGHYDVSFYGRNQHSHCALYSDNSIHFYGGRYDSNGNYLDYSSASIGNGIVGINGASNTLWYHLNFPVFGDEDSVVHFLSTGDYTGCLNLLKEKLDYSLLSSVIPATLSPITGKQLTASSMLDLYEKMKGSYHTQIKPQLETETDTDVNTQIFIDTMTGTVEETAQDVIVDPEPGTKPDPGTDPDPGTKPDPGTDPDPDTQISDYQVDLRSIFPFCIPFDFIALLDALDAEPAAPCFTIPVVIPALDYREDIKLDLSMFDDVAKVIRTCEKVSFLIFLMFATSKVIRW